MSISNMTNYSITKIIANFLNLILSHSLHVTCDFPKDFLLSCAFDTRSMFKSVVLCISAPTTHYACEAANDTHKHTRTRTQPF